MRYYVTFKRLKIKAIKTVAENEDRKRNIIIYGIKEEENEAISAKVEEVLAEIDEKPIIKDCCRVGSIKEECIRPVKFSLSSADMVQQVLRKARIYFQIVLLKKDKFLRNRERMSLNRRRKKNKESVAMRAKSQNLLRL